MAKAKKRGLKSIRTRPKAKVTMGFTALTKSFGPGVTNPAALAAAIGRKKFGAKRFAAMSAKGKKAR